MTSLGIKAKGRRDKIGGANKDAGGSDHGIVRIRVGIIILIMVKPKTCRHAAISVQTGNLPAIMPGSPCGNDHRSRTVIVVILVTPTRKRTANLTTQRDYTRPGLPDPRFDNGLQTKRGIVIVAIIITAHAKAAADSNGTHFNGRSWASRTMLTRMLGRCRKTKPEKCCNQQCVKG